MDKYEYRVRAEEINALIEKREYAEAVKIADTIDWRRVKSVTMLCKVSELYKMNRRYEDSKEILLLAYDRQPGSRKIVYSLCELCIKLEELVLAIEYYKEFVQIAPKDTGRFILQYRLYEAQDVSLEERIAVLEEYKKRDYREKWAYELAYLYHRIGLATRCVEECDELILWFGEGKYVIKAMELKMLHVPLTPTQREKYDKRFQSSTNAYVVKNNEEPSPAAEEEREPEQEAAIKEPVTTDTIPSMPIQIKAVEPSNAPTMRIPSKNVNEELEFREREEEEETEEQDFDPENISIDMPVIPLAQAPDDLDIHVKTMDMGEYNTINLQRELARNLAKVMEQEDMEASDATKALPVDSINDYTNGGFGRESLEDDNEQYAASTPIDTAVTKEVVSEVVKALGPAGHSEPITEEDLLNSLREQEEALPESIAEQVYEELKDEMEIQETPLEAPAYEEAEAAEPVLAAEPKEEMVDEQITGQLSFEDIMAEWEETRKANEAKHLEEMRQKVLRQTGPMFKDFDEAAKASVQADLDLIAPSLNVFHEQEPEEEPIINNPGYLMDDEEEDIPEYKDNETLEGSGTYSAGYEEPAREPETYSAGYEEPAREPETYSTGYEEAIREPEAFSTGYEGPERKPEAFLAGYGENVKEPEAYSAGYGENVKEPETYSAGYGENVKEPETYSAGYKENVGEPETYSAGYEEPAREPETYSTGYEEPVRAPEAYSAEYEETTIGQSEAASIGYEETTGQSDIPVTTGYEEPIQKAAPMAGHEKPAQEPVTHPVLFNTAEIYGLEEKLLSSLAEPEEAFNDGVEELEEIQDISVDEGVNEESGKDYPFVGAVKPEEESALVNTDNPAAEEVKELPPKPGTHTEEFDKSLEKMVMDALEESGKKAEKSPLRADTGFIITDLSKEPKLQKEEAPKVPAADQVRERPLPVRRSLTRDEKEMFGSIAQTRQVQEEVANAIDNISLSPCIGNVLITGEKGTGTLTVAKNLVKVLSVHYDSFSGKVAKITGELLNSKSIEETLNNLTNGALIVEQAGKLDDMTLLSLNEYLKKKRNGGILVIMEDTKKELDNLLLKANMPRQFFDLRIDIAALDNNGLVNYGKEYANEKEYSIDDMGILALYTRISDMQTNDHAVTVDEVRKIVDEAIRNAEKKNISHFMDVLLAKRYDDEDMIVLREKDFLK